MIFALPQPQSGLLLLLLQGEGDEEEEEEKEKGAFGGVPYYGATNLVRGVPKWVWGAHAGGSTGAFDGTPYGATTKTTAATTSRRARSGRRRSGTPKQSCGQLERSKGGGRAGEMDEEVEKEDTTT